jgi:hypothetical protein
MENARVGLFEDNPALRSLLRIWVEKHRHKVVLEATNREESQLAISGIRRGEISLDIAVIDGDLDYAGEGARIAATLEEADPSIARIGYSGNDGGVQGTVNIKKTGNPSDISAIIEFIDALPDRPTDTES